MSKKVKIDHHFNTQVNINNYNKIINCPNLLFFDINNIPEIFGNKKLNITECPNNLVSIDLCNMKAKDIKINMLSKKTLLIHYLEKNEIEKKKKKRKKFDEPHIQEIKLFINSCGKMSQKNMCARLETEKNISISVNTLSKIKNNNYII